MEIGDLIIRSMDVDIAHQFRAEEIKEALFIQLPPDANRGLVCFIDKFGEAPTESCRGYRIQKIPEGKKVAIVRPTFIPDIVWERAFPFDNCNLTPKEQAKAALEALDINTIVEHLSTYTLECLLAEKGLHRADCKFALEVGLKITEAFALLTKAIDEAYDNTNDPMCLVVKNKLNGWRSEILQKCKVGLEHIL